MANLENIKLGDSVIFSSGGWGRRTIIAKVTRVMPKQFEVGSYRFRKKDGAMIGDTYNQCRLATEKDISDFKMEQHRNSLRSTISQFFMYHDKINSLSVDEMEKIVEVIKDKIQA